MLRDLDSNQFQLEISSETLDNEVREPNLFVVATLLRHLQLCHVNTEKCGLLGTTSTATCV